MSSAEIAGGAEYNVEAAIDFYNSSKSDMAGTITNFDDVYKTYRLRGLSHIESKNKAIDEWRKWDRRKVAETEEFSLDDIEAEVYITPETLYDFNVLIRRVRAITYDSTDRYLDGTKYETRYGKKEKVLKLFFLICRLEDLDWMMDAENLQTMTDCIGEVQLDSMADVAVAMGFKVKANGCSNTLTEWKYGLQNLLHDFNIFQGINGSLRFA